MAAMLHYLRARYWEQEVASKWLKAVDNKTHQAYKTRYDEVDDAGELDILFQGPETCYMGSSLLINMAVQPQKDIEDVKRGWVGTNNRGQYEGAFAIFHELGIKVPQRPGTTILSRPAVSTHSISVTESGFRFSHVWYFKAAVLDPILAKKRSDEDEDDFSPPDKKSSDVSQNDGPAHAVQTEKELHLSDSQGWSRTSLDLKQWLQKHGVRKMRRSLRKRTGRGRRGQRELRVVTMAGKMTTAESTLLMVDRLFKVLAV